MRDRGVGRWWWGWIEVGRRRILREGGGNEK